ncbi:MAG: hypothetical protein JW990_19470, partial [Thermoleophilia bacterium]|nr:hypothetical protein [Thermoleophilia bacterium]
MNNAGSMTSAERLEALRRGEPLDRVPLLYFILGFCAKNSGYPVSSIYGNPGKSLEAQLRTQEEYGYDSEPFFGYASYGGYEFGGEIRLPDGEYQQAPSIARFPVEEERGVEDLTLPDVRTAGMLPSAMRFAHLQVEHGITPSVVVGGPFTVAGNICGVDRLCRWLVKKPALVDRLLRLATDHLVDVARHWIDTFGAGRVYMQVWEPLTSNQIISPRHFETVVLPYQMEFHQRVLEMGIGQILCHICGEQNQNLPAWTQVPMGEGGIVSIGSEVNISTAIEHFG